MNEFISSGRVIDAVLVLMLLEFLALVIYNRCSGRGIAPLALGVNLVSGAGLLLAIRALIGSGWWGWTAVFLAMALAAHVVDLRLRWRRPH